MAGTKRAIPEATRRAVAIAAGIEPGESGMVPCHHCGVLGRVTWARLTSGRPGAWVHFEHELDHVEPEHHGGGSTPENVVLACRSCNRKKGHRVTD